MLDEVSFGYLLSPSTLEADLPKLSKDELGALLKTFLLVFQSEQAKNNSHSAGMYFRIVATVIYLGCLFEAVQESSFAR